MRPSILAQDPPHAIGYSSHGEPIALRDSDWVPALPGTQRTLASIIYEVVQCDQTTDFYWIRLTPPLETFHDYVTQLLARLDENSVRPSHS